MAKKKSAVGKKIGKIMSEGIRSNTHAPVSKSNPRRKVSHKQAVAVALSMAGKSNKKSGGKKKFSQKKFDSYKNKVFQS